MTKDRKPHGCNYKCMSTFQGHKVTDGYGLEKSMNTNFKVAKCNPRNGIFYRYPILLKMYSSCLHKSSTYNDNSTQSKTIIRPDDVTMPILHQGPSTSLSLELKKKNKKNVKRSFPRKLSQIY